MVLPYTKGCSESFKNGFGKVDIQVHFKRKNTIRSLLVVHKDKDSIIQKSGVIYKYKCDSLECDEEYIGECIRTFEERLKEYLRAPPPFMTMLTP